MNKPDFSSIEGANKDYGSTWKRYGQSKLGNILFTSELQERLKGENIKVNCCHPGNIETELHRGPAASYGMIAVRSAPLLVKLSVTIFKLTFCFTIGSIV